MLVSFFIKTSKIYIILVMEFWIRLVDESCITINSNTIEVGRIDVFKCSSYVRKLPARKFREFDLMFFQVTNSKLVTWIEWIFSSSFSFQLDYFLFVNKFKSLNLIKHELIIILVQRLAYTLIIFKVVLSIWSKIVQILNVTSLNHIISHFEISSSDQYNFHQFSIDFAISFTLRHVFFFTLFNIY